MSHREILAQADIGFVISSFLNPGSRVIFAFICRDWHTATRPHPKQIMVPKYFAITPQQLKWAYTHGCSSESIKSWAKTPDVYSRTLPRLAEMAARVGDLRFLFWIFGLFPFILDDLREMSAAAAENGHLACLRWLCAHYRTSKMSTRKVQGSLWDQRVCAFAAKNGHYEVLKWTRSCTSPPPWDWRTYAYAAIGNHQKIVAWLATNGGSWASFVEKARRKNRDPVRMVADTVTTGGRDRTDHALLRWAHARLSMFYPRIVQMYKLAGEDFFRRRKQKSLWFRGMLDDDITFFDVVSRIEDKMVIDAY